MSRRRPGVNPSAAKLLGWKRQREKFAKGEGRRLVVIEEWDESRGDADVVAVAFKYRPGYLELGEWFASRIGGLGWSMWEVINARTGKQTTVPNVRALAELVRREGGRGVSDS